MTSLVIAGITFGINKEIPLKDTSKDKINAINEDPIERNNITCDNLQGELDGSEVCRQKMWKGNYKLGEVKVSAVECDEYNKTSGECILYVAFSDAIIKDKITEQQKNKLEDIVRIRLSPEVETEKKVIEDAGTITLSKKVIEIGK